MSKIGLVSNTHSDEGTEQPLARVEAGKVASEKSKAKVDIDLNALLGLTPKSKVDKESPAKVEEKIEKPTRKTTEAQRRAISKYESNFKRINCRLSPEIWEKIQATGESANTVIVKALTAYLADDQSR